MENPFLLGNEAVALGALHAGITGAYAYPGTPSTEILHYLVNYKRRHKTSPHIAEWAVNEKTAYDQALGMSLVGKRALVAMKHVGLNVAADSFYSSSIVALHGGLVLAVADDPGMHSSQNEQDSRVYADAARVLCLEPSNHQECYDMAREAFDLSEKLRMPVMVRIVTRLAHARGTIQVRPPRSENQIQKAPDARSWILMPVNAKRQWRSHLDNQPALTGYTEGSGYNTIRLSENSQDVGVITTGLALHYYNENKKDLGFEPSHLHIGTYPIPTDKVRELASRVKTLYVFEEGQPFFERQLRGILPQEKLKIIGKLSGALPLDGELTPELVRKALGLAERKGMAMPGVPIPDRPPQLCPGCPHTDTYMALKEALGASEAKLVTGDVGCYTLGAYAPLSAIETCVCMGSSIGLAKGAADAGFPKVAAVLGDSTFLHSGISPLIDAVNSNSPITVFILDNLTVAMTGGQPTAAPSSRFEDIVIGLGVNPEHVHVATAHKKFHKENVELIKKELEYPGLSVIIAVRECVQTVRRSKEGSVEEMA